MYMCVCVGHSGRNDTLFGKFMCIFCIRVSRDGVVARYNSSLSSVSILKKSEERNKKQVPEI
jgi:hypothetical protein